MVVPSCVVHGLHILTFSLLFGLAASCQLECMLSFLWLFLPSDGTKEINQHAGSSEGNQLSSLAVEQRYYPYTDCYIFYSFVWCISENCLVVGLGE